MLRFVVLSSGSSGNVSAVWNGETGLLIDAGTGSSRGIETALRAAGLRPEGIAGILITHAHSDHFGRPARVLAKKYRVPILTHRETWQAACRRCRDFLDLEERGLLLPLREDADHLHGDFQIRTHAVPHGGAEAGRPLGFTIRAGGREVFYSTDLGMVPAHLPDAMRTADFILLESNYDDGMEAESGRPEHLIRWVTGPTGHLSNEQASAALGQVFAPGHAKYPRRVVLGHLSEDCNTPELALAEVKRRVPRDVPVHVAARYEASAVWEV
ncbi:MAG: MBL fold metallo-hydrolase [Candidatus Brocadiae bacterium]|nr:MBL fold metallo-hydrolase [Candidatus Brocadiia bacterium]